MKTLLIAGPKGNLRGVGARITFRTKEGRAVTREITAGAGYLSQSLPAVWIPEDVDAIEAQWPGEPPRQHPLKPHTTLIKLP